MAVKKIEVNLADLPKCANCGTAMLVTIKKDPVNELPCLDVVHITGFFGCSAGAWPMASNTVAQLVSGTFIAAYAVKSEVPA